MSSMVHFVNFRSRSRADSKSGKLLKLFDAAGFDRLVTPGALVAVKVHFGELGSDCFVRPVFVRAVVDRIRELGGKPFVTDTNTLYSGSRYNAVDHMETAIRHGFSFASVNAPVLIADGLLGESVTQFPVNKKHFQQVKLAGAFARADACIMFSHFKGHELAGFGGAIKNLAMGCAPGAGKREQHSPRFQVDAEPCIGCGECERICPVQAAVVGADAKAVIDKALCIGCGECFQCCPTKAVQIDWATQIPPFMERMTEYALGAHLQKAGRIGYINFVMDVTPDCDCLPWSDAPIVPDVGILAASDPVALDQASLDLVNAQEALPGTHLCAGHACGENKFNHLWTHTRGELQLSYGEEIGLGSRTYTLTEC